MQVFLKKLLTNDKYKNLLLEYKKGNITDSGDELTMITRNIPGLIKMVRLLTNKCFKGGSLFRRLLQVTFNEVWTHRMFAKSF